MAVFILGFTAYSQESLTITTYYPAPFGVYEELRARRQAVGEDYIDSSQYPFSNYHDGASLLVQGRVGIGQPWATHTWPAVPLDVDSRGISVNSWDGTVALFRDSGESSGGWARGIAFGKENRRPVRMGILGTGSGAAGADPFFHLRHFYISVDQNSTTPWHDGHFTVGANGFVGIGTTAPQAKLDVTDGSITADTIIIKKRSGTPSPVREGEIWLIE
jgi:hypothetical protein